MKFHGFEDLVALIEKNEQRLGIGGKRKRFVGLRDRDGKALRSCGCSDSHFYWYIKQPHMAAAHVLSLLHFHAHLLSARIVGGAHGKTRSARAVDPFFKEAIDVDVG